MYVEIELKQYLNDYKAELAMIVATTIEFDTLLEYMTEYDDDLKIFKIQEGEYTFYCGKYNKYSIVLVKTNSMGAMMSGSSQQTMSKTIELFNPKAVIMGGIAYGKSIEKQNIADILVAKSIIQYESSRINREGNTHYRSPSPETDFVLINRFTQESQFTFQHNKKEHKVKIISGPLLTGEKLVDNINFRDKLFTDFPNAIGGEMESFGIYTACREKKIPWIIIKSICDWADGNKDKTMQSLAAKSSFAYIYKCLNSELILKQLDILPYKTRKVELPEIIIDASDILKLIISKRDFLKLTHNLGTKNSDKKIYYEYYTYKDKDRLKGYLFLGKYITIKNVFEDFVLKNKQLPKYLEIFLTKKKRDDNITIDRIKALKEKLTNSELTDIKESEIHYIDDFIWNNTDLKQEKRSFHKRTDFIDQNLYSYDIEENKDYFLGESIHYFKKEVNKEFSAISVVLGSGGIGKTTFCETLAYTIDNAEEIRKKVFFIKGEKVVKFFLENEKEIETIDDLYEIYKGESEFDEIDSLDFNLNFISGNVIVIIDAIEEIESALNDKFDLQCFFESINLLNKRFHSIKIIVTTREHFIPKMKELKNISNINYYKLCGFKDDNLDKFLKNKYDSLDKSNAVKEFIKINKLYIDNTHIVPLFVDWICNIIDRPEAKKTYKSKYFIEDVQIDSLLMKLLAREIEKQSLNIEIDGMFKLFEEIVIHHNGLIKKECLKDYLEIEVNGDVDNFIKNPLFYSDGNKIKMKYDILNNLIKVRYLRYMTISKNNPTNEMIHLLKDGYIGKGEIYDSLKEVLNNHSNFKELIKFQILKLIKEFNNSTRDIYTEQIKRSISTYLHLLFNRITLNDSTERINLINDTYGVTANGKIKNLFIYGDFPSLDFRTSSLIDCTFENYFNLVKCKFPKDDKKIFYSTTFKNFDIPKNSQIKNSFFDSSCIFKKCNIKDITNKDQSETESKTKLLENDIITISKYIETSEKSMRSIKKYCDIKYARGESKLLSRLLTCGFIQEVSKDTYKINSIYYDELPSIKLGEFPNIIKKEFF